MDTDNLSKQFYDFEIFVTPEGSDLGELSGNNHKKLLIALGKEDYTKETNTLLSKIIQAVGYNIAEDALLLQLERDRDTSVQSLKQTYDLKSIICFGLSPARLGIHMQLPMYQIIQQEGLQLLRVDTLTQVAEQKSAKAALWKALQLMFPK